jgi:phosphate-selective porin OprO/OprP
VQADFRSVLSDDPTIIDDQFLLRRVRPIVEGTVGGIYDFRFTPDFAQGKTVIQDAYITGRFSPYFQLTPASSRRRSGSSACSRRATFVHRARVSDPARHDRDIGVQIAAAWAAKS